MGLRAGRCGCARWVGGGGCQQGGFDPGIGSDGFLTRRDYAGMRLGEIQRIEYFLADAVVL